MEKRGFLPWIRRFTMIHGITMIGFYIVASLTRATFQLDMSFLGDMILFSFLASLPGFVYISRHELSDREWIIRTVLHLLLLYAVLLPFSREFGLWYDRKSLLILCGSILIEDILVHAIVCGMDFVSASRINRRLKAMKEERRSGNPQDP